MTNNTIDFKAVKDTKEFIENANNRIFELENALYKILETKDLAAIQELAADVLGEDLDTYLEGELLPELNFEDDKNIVWEDIQKPEYE